MSTSFLWQQRVAWCQNFLLQGVSPWIVGGKSLVLGQEKGIQRLAESRATIHKELACDSKEGTCVWQQHSGNLHPVIYSMKGLRANGYFEFTLLIHH
jgi:hypothetical protein